MREVTQNLLITLLAVCLLMAGPALSQYEISWFTIDGGGGTSTGGPYELVGTIGQPDADWCSGGKYELLGGFWPGGPIECFPRCHPDYDRWLAVGMPACWCYPRQCQGDADNQKEGSEKKGYYYVHFDDLNVLLAGWDTKEPPHGPGIATVTGPNGEPGICADFAHDQEGSAKKGYYRVHFSDLNILIANWNTKEPPDGPGVEPNCLDCP